MRRYIYSLATDQRAGGIHGVVKVVLKGFSFLYGAAVNLRNILYELGLFKSYNVGIPVISIGNITMGGAGKTPLVLFLAQWLVDDGVKPVILIRGYTKDRTKDPISDEVKLLHMKLKGVDVLQGPDRVKNAKEYLKDHRCDVFILDDGFQHRKIFRDLNIVALDMTNPFGNGELIPRGILRESLGALSRSDMIFFTRTDLGQDKIASTRNVIARINPQADVIETIHKPLRFVDMRNLKEHELSALKGKNVLAFCAIGNPSGFEGTLKKIGVNISGFEIFEDHHSYVESDIRRLVTTGKDLGAAALVTTLKDAVKLQPFFNNVMDQVQIFYLDITIEVTTGQERFIHRIHHLLHR